MKKNTIKFYDKIYSPLFKKKYTKKSNRAGPSLRQLEIFRKSNKIDIHKVIDVGCSWGMALKYWKKRNVYAVGADVSKIVVKHCKKHKFNCKRSSATDLSKFNDKSFDLYMSTDVYEHIRAKDLQFAIEEAIRVTSKYFLIRVHTTLDKRGTLHLTVWDLDRWASFFMNNGLKILNFGDGEFNTYKNTFFMEI